MIHEANNENPSVVNYVMFVAVFGMLSLIYLILATVNEAFAINPLFMVIADALNTLFFLVGGIALAARLGVHSCGNERYLLRNSVTDGSSKRCREAQAVTAFLWFGFVAFAASLILSALGARRGSNLGGSSIRKGGV
jgi:hypothetical protein